MILWNLFVTFVEMFCISLLWGVGLVSLSGLAAYLFVQIFRFEPRNIN